MRTPHWELLNPLHEPSCPLARINKPNRPILKENKSSIVNRTTIRDMNLQQKANYIMLIAEGLRVGLLGSELVVRERKWFLGGKRFTDC